jgi:hypothetical protein
VTFNRAIGPVLNAGIAIETDQENRYKLIRNYLNALDAELDSAAVELALAIRDREREEQRFWKTFEGRRCCGTMKDCPMRDDKTENETGRVK